MSKCIDCKYYSPDFNKRTICRINASWPHSAYCTEFEQATVQHKPDTIDIIKEIGLPAALEQLAEECCELGQATLKLARKLRGENPTPKSIGECEADLLEETGDVLVCLNTLGEAGVIIKETVDSIIEAKNKRWQERLNKEEA